MSGTTLLFFQYIFTPFALCVGVYLLVAGFKEPYWTSKIIWILMALYPLGKVVQMWKLGPDYVMWYMSDVGFVPIMAVFLCQELHKRDPNPEKAFRQLLVSATIVLSLAMAVELFQMSTNKYTEGVTFVARGDWVDFVCYLGSYALLLSIGHHQQRRYNLAKADLDELEREIALEEANQREAGRLRRRGAPKKASQNKRKHRHGRRY